MNVFCRCFYGTLVEDKITIYDNKSPNYNFPFLQLIIQKFRIGYDVLDALGKNTIGHSASVRHAFSQYEPKWEAEDDDGGSSDISCVRRFIWESALTSQPPPSWGVMDMSWNCTGNSLAVVYGPRDLHGWCDVRKDCLGVCIWTMNGPDANCLKPEMVFYFCHSKSVFQLIN